MLIDVAIPGDRNVIKKEAKMITKYKDLRILIQRTWNVTANVNPVIMGATATISIKKKKNSDTTRTTYQVSTKLRNCQKKEPYCALHTYYGKC
jgi:hypothetical protein